MITFDDVKYGYEHGVVTFQNADLYLGFDEIVCVIGYWGNYNWFYFGGLDAETHSNPDEFLDDVGIDNALSWVTGTLDEMREIDPDEYAFYEAILNECKEEE